MNNRGVVVGYGPGRIVSKWDGIGGSAPLDGFLDVETLRTSDPCWVLVPSVMVDAVNDQGLVLSNVGYAPTYVPEPLVVLCLLCGTCGQAWTRS
jgi:hypothetical protein